MTEASSASDEGSELNTPAPEGENQDSSETPVTEPTQDVKDPASSSTADGTPSDEGGDEGAKEPVSMVDALEKAVEQDKQDAETPPASSEDQKSDAKAEEKSDAKAEDGDDKPPPFHEHPRWQQMMTERSELKEQVATLTSEKEQSAEAVEAIDRLDGFLKEKNLTPDEMNTMLQIGALMRNDPAQALEAMTPYYKALLEVTGTILPDDIQQAVNEGLVTEDYGKQLAKHRAGEQITAGQMELERSQHTATENDQFVQAMGNHATTWENSWAASDPDYEKKAKLVNEGIELRLLRGDIPDSAEAVVRMCEEEKTKVEAQMRTFLPKQKSMTPAPGSSGGPSNATLPAPKTMQEAMEQSIAGAYD